MSSFCQASSVEVRKRFAAAEKDVRTVCRRSGAPPCARHALNPGRGLDEFAARLMHLNSSAAPSSPTSLKVRVLGNSVAEWNGFRFAHAFVDKMNGLFPGVTFTLGAGSGSHSTASIGAFLPEHASLCGMKDVRDADVVLVFFNSQDGNDALLKSL